MSWRDQVEDTALDFVAQQTATTVFDPVDIVGTTVFDPVDIGGHSIQLTLPAALCSLTSWRGWREWWWRVWRIM